MYRVLLKSSFFMFTLGTTISCGESVPSFGELPKDSYNVTFDDTEVFDPAVDIEEDSQLTQEDIDDLLENYRSRVDYQDDDVVVVDDDSNIDEFNSGSDAVGNTDDDDTIKDDMASKNRGNSKSAREKKKSKQGQTEVTLCKNLFESEKTPKNLNQKDTSASPNDILFSRVTGSPKLIELNFESDSLITASGLCLFVTGNRNKVEINANNFIFKKLIVVARGNTQQIVINYNEDTSFASAIVDLRGNQSEVSFVGPMINNCPVDKLFTGGNSTSVVCR